MKTNGKPSKQADIVDQLRSDILAGVYPPGSRLPNQTQLTARFQVGNGTITLALKELSREGFIHARRKAGTFVRDTPPHLHNIVIAQPVAHRTEGHWSKYYEAFVRAAAVIQDKLKRPIHIIEGYADPANPERNTLNEVVRTHGAAGILFCYHPRLLIGTPALETVGMPRVAVMPMDASPGIDTAIHIGDGFFEKALSALAAAGRTRIAILGFREIDTETGSLAALLNRYGMRCPPCWNIRLAFSLPESARNVMRLMMRPEQRDRPDSLIITDDNLTEDAIAGAIAEGIRIPSDLTIVTHCNFPWPPFKTVPVIRLGTDIREVIRRAIDLIDRKRRGENIPNVMTLPAVWDPDAPDPATLDCSVRESRK